MTLPNSNVAVCRGSLDRINYENNDDLFIEMGANTSSEVDNFEALLLIDFKQISLEFDESVDCCYCVENGNEKIDADDECWIFDDDSNDPCIFY